MLSRVPLRVLGLLQNCGVFNRHTVYIVVHGEKKKENKTTKNTKSGAYRLTSVRGERAASPQLSPDPLLCPRSRSCRRATPEVPGPPSGWATRYCAPGIPDFLGIAVTWEGKGDEGQVSCRCSLGLGGKPCLLGSPSFFLALEHQVPLNDGSLILF